MQTQSQQPELVPTVDFKTQLVGVAEDSYPVMGFKPLNNQNSEELPLNQESKTNKLEVPSNLPQVNVVSEQSKEQWSWKWLKKWLWNIFQVLLFLTLTIGQTIIGINLFFQISSITLTLTLGSLTLSAMFFGIGALVLAAIGVIILAAGLWLWANSNVDKFWEFFKNNKIVSSLLIISTLATFAIGVGVLLAGFAAMISVLPYLLLAAVGFALLAGICYLGTYLYRQSILKDPSVAAAVKIANEVREYNVDSLSPDHKVIFASVQKCAENYMNTLHSFDFLKFKFELGRALGLMKKPVILENKPVEEQILPSTESFINSKLNETNAIQPSNNLSFYQIKLHSDALVELTCNCDFRIREQESYLVSVMKENKNKHLKHLLNTRDEFLNLALKTLIHSDNDLMRAFVDIMTSEDDSSYYALNLYVGWVHDDLVNNDLLLLILSDDNKKEIIFAKLSVFIAEKEENCKIILESLMLCEDFYSFFLTFVKQWHELKVFSKLLKVAYDCDTEMTGIRAATYDTLKLLVNSENKTILEELRNLNEWKNLNQDFRFKTDEIFDQLWPNEEDKLSSSSSYATAMAATGLPREEKNIETCPAVSVSSSSVTTRPSAISSTLSKNLYPESFLSGPHQ